MNLIFVCTGNTCRSPMAEVLAKSIFGENDINIEAVSRGISVFTPSGASENAVKAAYNLGLDLTEHVSKPISAGDIEWADLILTMTEVHKNSLKSICNNTALYTIKEFAGDKGNIVDPFGQDIEEYMNCALELKYYIANIAGKFRSKP